MDVEEILKSADNAFSEFLSLKGDVYFAKGYFSLRNGRYPFIAMLKSIDGKIKGVSVDKGGASNIEGLMTDNELHFIRTYTYNPRGINFDYARFADSDTWNGKFQAQGLSYIGETSCKIVSKDRGDKRLISLMGVEGILEIIEESPLGDMRFK